MTAATSIEAADTTIICEDYMINVQRTGRGYWASLDGQPDVAAFACQRSYAVSMLQEKVEAMRCESCGVIEGTRHAALCG